MKTKTWLQFISDRIVNDNIGGILPERIFPLLVAYYYRKINNLQFKDALKKLREK